MQMNDDGRIIQVWKKLTKSLVWARDYVRLSVCLCCFSGSLGRFVFLLSSLLSTERLILASAEVESIEIYFISTIAALGSIFKIHRHEDVQSQLLKGCLCEFLFFFVWDKKKKKAASEGLDFIGGGTLGVSRAELSKNQKSGFFFGQQRWHHTLKSAQITPKTTHLQSLIIVNPSVMKIPLNLKKMQT